MTSRLTAWTLVAMGLLGMAWLGIMTQCLPVPRESVLHLGQRVIAEAEKELGLPETPREYPLAVSAEDIWVDPGMLYVLTQYAKEQSKALQQRRMLITISAAVVAIFSAVTVLAGSRALKAMTRDVDRNRDASFNAHH